MPGNRCGRIDAGLLYAVVACANAHAFVFSPISHPPTPIRENFALEEGIFHPEENPMSAVPENLQYTKDHEWALVEGGVATVGVTDHAQRELGDIVFVELPKVGASVKAGESFGTIEAVKTVAELYAPVSGTVEAVNADLASDAGVINTDPYGKGWILRIKVSGDSEELMDAAAYKELI
jgi:glycine cleavage system H protein